jgi:hypothetical protein
MQLICTSMGGKEKGKKNAERRLVPSSHRRKSQSPDQGREGKRLRKFGCIRALMFLSAHPVKGEAQVADPDRRFILRRCRH